MKQASKTLALWLLLILVAVAVMHLKNQTLTSVEDIPFSEFMSAVDAKQISEVTVKEDIFSGKYKPEIKSGAVFKTMGPANVDTAFIQKLTDSGAHVYYQHPENNFWPQFLISWLPMILLFGFFFFSM